MQKCNCNKVFVHFRSNYFTASEVWRLFFCGLLCISIFSFSLGATWRVKLMYRLARTDSHAFDLLSYQIHAAYVITEAYRPSHTTTKGQAERRAPLWSLYSMWETLTSRWQSWCVVWPSALDLQCRISHSGKRQFRIKLEAELMV